MDCEIDEDETIILEDEEADVSQLEGFLSTITGAVIGGGATTWSVISVLVVLVIGSFVFFRIRKAH